MLCFAAQNLRYSVKNDVGLVVIDCPGKASGQDNTVISHFLYVLICYTIATSEKVYNIYELPISYYDICLWHPYIVLRHPWVSWHCLGSCASLSLQHF